MARKPNYGFEKRQKEIAKKAKKEEKKMRKAEDSVIEAAELAANESPATEQEKE